MVWKSDHQKDKLIIFSASFSEPYKNLIAATLASMAKSAGVFFDVYYGAPPVGGNFQLGRDAMKSQGGGLFSHFGSTLIGGQHQRFLNRAMAEFDTCILRLGEMTACSALCAPAATVIDLPSDLLEIYQLAADLLGIQLPQNATLIQFEDLPEKLCYDISQYLSLEILHREAIGLPLEISLTGIEALKRAGIQKVYTVSTAKADLSKWQASKFDLVEAEVLDLDETYRTLTLRLAHKWLAELKGVDFCEPVLASYWLPHAVRTSRALGIGESMLETLPDIAELVHLCSDQQVYGRYAGGPIGGAKDDEDLFPLFEKDIAFQVIEPRRPVLSVLSAHKHRLPEPPLSTFDCEPDDATLETWVRQGKILTTLIYHSGELSHDDGIYNMMELSALTGVKVGIGVQSPRYIFDPECVELTSIATRDGGVLEHCEPVLHSAGLGIHAEALGQPEMVAAMIAKARAQITEIAGNQQTPRGVYFYLDAQPGEWHRKNTALWEAVASLGFEYMISSVGQGENQILHHVGDCVVLNMGLNNHYPYSPFVRITSSDQLRYIERQLAGRGKAGWIIGVVDTPIFTYLNYLVKGQSNPVIRKPEVYADTTLGLIYAYIEKRGETDKLVSATPHTISRYARLLHEHGILK